MDPLPPAFPPADALARRWRQPSPAERSFETAPGVVAPAGRPAVWGRRAPARPAARATAPDAAPLQTTTGLEPYVPTADAPWTLERAYHLLQRTGFGASVGLAQAVLATTPGAAAEALVGRAASLPLPPLPPWHGASIPPWQSPQFQVYLDTQPEWLNAYEWEVFEAMLHRRGATELDRAGHALREKLALMWSNHFVTEHSTYYFAPFLSRYWGLMRQHALGDFRAFVGAVGQTPAMLIYLNGQENRAGSPNENYARELLELFTTGLVRADGQPAYTQADVVDLARALTGWYVDYQGDLDGHFNPAWHDAGTKTILGQTGAWGYADVVPLLFAARAPEIARFVCRKLYREFVFHVPDEGVVAEMAALFQASSFQTEPVVRALLASAHFYDGAVVRARIKSPAERTMGLWRTVAIPATTDEQGWLWWQMQTTGQVVFEPPNVAGWPGGRPWVDTATLPVRWMHDDHSLWFAADTLRAFALTLPAPYAAAAFVRDVSTLVLGRVPTADALASYTDILLDGLPAYEWNPTADGAQYRIRALLVHLTRLPEAQLV